MSLYSAIVTCVIIGLIYMDCGVIISPQERQFLQYMFSDLCNLHLQIGIYFALWHASDLLVYVYK